MTGKCLLAANEIAKQDDLNSTSVAMALSNLDSMKFSRIIVTDHNGIAVYDSLDLAQTAGKYILLPEIVQALQGNDVFSWSYHDGRMLSRVATPIISYGTLTGCVYMMEYDSEQGALIKNLQNNTLMITVAMGLLVVLFSIIFARVYTHRLRKIMDSMRIIHEGNYSHKVSLKGNNELSALGNEFNALVERLQTSEQKRNNFVSDASHELKTPLASIKLLSDSILQNDMDIQTMHEFVEDIGKEAERLNRMSQKLLALSRIETQADSDCEIINISPTVERVLRMLSANAQQNEITIYTEIENDCLILIIEDDLYQILFNLIENGIKYNVHGGSLCVKVHRNGDNAVIIVKDTGVGIPEDSLEHIFERFYRVDKARARKTGGNGLGLSIVRGLVERNNGTIGVESTVGEGTVFTVSFPVIDMEDEE